MKTSFSRTVFPAVLLLLTALGSAGILFQLFVKNNVENQAVDLLKTGAVTVADLAGAYYNEGIVEPEQFFVNMEMVARISDTDTVICDNLGTLVMCSDAPMGCDHQGMVIDRDHLNQVFATGFVVSSGRINGLYEDSRTMVSVPIVGDNGTNVGIVIASMPVTATLGNLYTVGEFYYIAALVVALVCIVIVAFSARRRTHPLGKLTRVAADFGHGNLNARMDMDPNAPEDVQALALAFNNMADSLQKSDYRRQEFVANVSHELKTPMTTIAGFADGILDGTIPPEQQRKYLQLISDETKRLNRLVRSMLDVSKLQERGGIPPEMKTRFDIEECAGRVLLTFERKIYEKNLDVQVDFPEYPIYVRAQEDQIVQVIYNLLDNAVKFCPQFGVLELHLRPGSSKVFVSVANSGDTIPAEELPLVFDKFHKLDKSRSQKDGWGLGLYIVKSIVGAHGEDLSVTSENGRTEFTFTLPLVP